MLGAAKAVVVLAVLSLSLPACDLVPSTPASTAQDDRQRLTDVFSQLRRLGQEMANAAQSASREYASRAGLEETRAMMAHQARFNYTIISAEGVAMRENGRNAILQAHANKLNASKTLLDKGSLPVLRSLSEATDATSAPDIAEQIRTHQRLSTSIKSALRTFKASPAITSAERRDFEKRHSDLDKAASDAVAAYKRSADS